MENCSDMANGYNIEAHYSTNPKVTKTARAVVNAPNSLPTYHLYNDIDANKRLAHINNDVYVESKRFQKNEQRNFTKIFLGIVAVILATLGIKKLIK